MISLQKPQGLVVERRQLIYLRDLVWTLVLRDMRIRYKRSILGFAWTLLNPLLQLVVLDFVFRLVLPLNIPNYTIFLLTGLLAWGWFQASLMGATGAIVDNREFIRQPHFPLAILPLAIVTTNLVYFLLAQPILLVFWIFGGHEPSISLLFFPFLVALQYLFTLGLAYVLATLHVTFRDTQYLLNILLLLAFYLTPIFYDVHTIPAKFQSFYQLNPLVHLIDGYRAIFIRGEPPEFWPLLIIGLVSLMLLTGGYRLFIRASSEFAEEL